MLVLVVLPILLNAIALFPEVRYPTPSDNDQIFHYLFIERANQALAAGDNPFDHWLPELELGFPQFLYYQNLPHLTVVALHHLLLKRVSLLTLLNLVRYLLMVLFPLTVYWSMRRMEFSTIAAAVGAAFSSTLSSRFDYGFDYHSYIWLGVGMFPQLCSMHLMFIGTACLRGVLERSKGFAAAIIASSAMVLSDLLYGYIFAIAALILWLLSMLKQAARANGRLDTVGRLSRLSARFASVALIAALITAYQTVPFFQQLVYLNRVYPGHIPHDSFGVSGVLSNLLTGHVFDSHRLPVVTTLVLLGILYSAVTRSAQAKIALTVLATYTVLAFGRATLGSLFNLLPLSQLVPFQRLVSGGDFGAILLAGLGGELLWKWWPSNSSRIRAIASVAVLLVLCTLALAQRWTFYRTSTHEMKMSAQALRDDRDLPKVMSALKEASPGRVYAGTRGNWGTWMAVGNVYLYDLLPIERFATVMPWQTLSLNAPLMWQLNIPSAKLCRLFNIRYVVAPPTLRTPSSYRPLVTTSHYNLYEVDSGGYMQLGQIARVLPMASNSDLYARNRDWIASQEPAEGRFIAFRPAGDQSDGDLEAAANPSFSAEDAPQLGLIQDEVVTPDSLSAQVTASSSTLLILKVTYHPNWHVTVDGREQHAFMVSPSFIGSLIAPGRHQVKAEYRSSELKKWLLLLSCVTLAATIGIWAFDLEHRFFGSFSA